MYRGVCSQGCSSGGFSGSFEFGCSRFSSSLRFGSRNGIDDIKLVVSPIPLERFTICKPHDTSPFLLSTQESPFMNVAITVLHLALAVRQAVLRTPGVFVAIGPYKHALALRKALLPVSSVLHTVGPSVSGVTTDGKLGHVRVSERKSKYFAGADLSKAPCGGMIGSGESNSSVPTAGGG